MSLKTLTKLSGVGGAAYAAVCLGKEQKNSPQGVHLSKSTQKDNFKKIENFHFMKSKILPEIYASDKEISQLYENDKRLKNAIDEASGKINCKLVEVGAPGMMVSVSVNGETIWSKGFGYVDLEKRHTAGWTHPVRIGNISLSIFSAVLAKLWEEGRLDLEKKVCELIPDSEEETKIGELLHEVFLDLSDMSKLTMVIRLMEEIVGENIGSFMKDQFQILGLNNTYLDHSDEIIYWRSNHYFRDKEYKLRNVPQDDNETDLIFLSSVLDLVRFGNILLYSLQRDDDDDLKDVTPKDESCQDNILNDESPQDKDMKDEASNDNSVPKSEKTDQKAEYLPGYLKSSSMDKICYDLTRTKKQFGFCQDSTEYVTMSGNGQGASSILLIISSPSGDEPELPQGVVVAILCNLQDVDLKPLASKIASLFVNLDLKRPVTVHEVFQC